MPVDLSQAAGPASTARGTDGLAVKHLCPWCRSTRVTVAVAVREDSRAPAAAGRCVGCERDVVLVPAHLVC